MAQTNADFRVVIVANEDPECDLPVDARLEVARVSFPPPNLPVGVPVTTDAMYADKGAKLGVGTAIAVRAAADYVMFVDSDDYISREIAAFVARAQGEPGWYSDSGYYHVRGSRTVTPVFGDFHQRNGSTHILRTDLIGVPADVDPARDREDVIDRIGRLRVRSLMGDHKWIVSYFADMGEPLAKLPFPAAIWEIGNGENFSQVLVKAGTKEPVAGAVAAEFGLRVPSRAAALHGSLSNVRSRVSTKVARRFESMEEQRDRLQGG